MNDQASNYWNDMTMVNVFADEPNAWTLGGSQVVHVAIVGLSPSATIHA
jgi:hypothetical protein